MSSCRKDGGETPETYQEPKARHHGASKTPGA